MKQEINVFDYAEAILKGVKSGVLVTTKAGETVNSMAISWGTLGIEWGKPIFTTFVREGRFTRQLLDQNPEFTINVPLGDFDKNIIGVCGSKSGRDLNKIEALGLTLVEPEVISVPAIKELPLTLECRVIYWKLQDREAIPQEIKAANYPQDVASDYPYNNKDFHVTYCGEIVKAYIIK